MYTTLLALMFACGDAEEAQDIPTPPAKEVKEAPKAAPKAEAPKPEPEEVAAAPMKVVKMEHCGSRGWHFGGTKPEVKTSEKADDHQRGESTTIEAASRQSETYAHRKSKERRLSNHQKF